MWIKTSGGELINGDRLAGMVFNPKHNQTVMVMADGSTSKLCKGDARDIIARAIQCDQKYLEVFDYE